MRLMPVSLDGHNLPKTQRRLAQRVASAFGVDLGGSPAAQTWAANYGALTVSEIARGGLYPSREWHLEAHASVSRSVRLGESPLLPRGTQWIGGHGLITGTSQTSEIDEGIIAGLIRVTDRVPELAPATVSRFGPDSKAALVLAGSNDAFGDLVPVFDEVIDLLRHSNPMLGNRALLTVWATLVLECYRSQPLLFSAAVTAREIQRALTRAWAPAVAPGLVCARAEYRNENNTADPRDPALHPNELNILDDTLRRAELITATQGDATGATVHTREDIIQQWTSQLLDSDDSGFVWITESANGQRLAHALVDPYGALHAFDKSTWGPFPGHGLDLEDRDIWPRLCPNPPPMADANRLSSQGQSALVWVLVQCYRLLRLQTRQARARASFQDHIFEQLQELIELSERLLGPAHPLTYYAQSRLHMSRVSGAQSQAAPESHADSESRVSAEAKAGRDLAVTLARLNELRQGGRASDDFVAEALVSAAPSLRRAIEKALRADDIELAESLRHDVMHLWEQFFQTINVDLDAELDRGSDGLPTGLGRLASRLHNYAGFLARNGDLEMLRRALPLMDLVVIPARAELAEDRGDDRPLRLSLQVGIDAIDRFLKNCDPTPPECAKWAGRAWFYHSKLADLPTVQGFMLRDTIASDTEAICLASLVVAELVALENGLPEGPKTLTTTRWILERIANYRSLNPTEAGPNQVASADVRSLQHRLATLERRADPMLPVLAEASVPVRIEPLPDGITKQVPLASGELFSALRGSPTKLRSDEWPVLRMTWPADDGIARRADARPVLLKLAEPFISPGVKEVTVYVIFNGQSRQAELNWRTEPGQHVELSGVVSDVPAITAPTTLEVKVVVRGIADSP